MSWLAEITFSNIEQFNWYTVIFKTHGKGHTSLHLFSKSLEKVNLYRKLLVFKHEALLKMKESKEKRLGIVFMSAKKFIPARIF